MGFGVRITMRIQTLYSVIPKLALHLAILNNPSRFRLVRQSQSDDYQIIIIIIVWFSYCPNHI